MKTEVQKVNQRKSKLMIIAILFLFLHSMTMKKVITFFSSRHSAAAPHFKKSDPDLNF